MLTCARCKVDYSAAEPACPLCGLDIKGVQKPPKTDSDVAEMDDGCRQLLDQLMALAKSLDSNALCLLVKEAQQLAQDKNRQHSRQTCLIPTDYVAGSGRMHQDYIRDISCGGAYIETDQEFEIGQEVKMTLALSPHIKPFRISGNIVRASPGGIGIQFEAPGQVQQQMIEKLVEKVKEFNRNKV